MPLPTPEPGLVVGYAYLWQDEFDRGQEEGTKDRPCAIVLTAIDATAIPLSQLFPSLTPHRNIPTKPLNCCPRQSNASALMRNARGLS
jgi:hypothetical protein